MASDDRWRVWKRRGPAALVIGLLACAAATAPTAIAPVSDAAAAERQNVPKRVFVWATTGGGAELGRPQRALVRIRSRGKLLGQARTGARGIAIVRLRRTPPRRFSVEVRGGILRGGHRVKRIDGALRARVSGYRRQSVYVNPATTLAYFYKAQHPRLSERRVRNRVRRFLRLPRRHGIAAGLRSTPFFDGRRYIAAARRGGGLDRYSRALAATIGKGKGRSFATRRKRVRDDAAGASALESESLGGLAGLSQSLGAYRGIFGAIGGVSGALSIVNTVMSLSGVSPLDQEVDQLNKEMGELLASMHYVEGELKRISGQIESARQEGAEDTYATLKGQQDTLMGSIDAARVHWEKIANLGAQISCPNGTESCPEAQPVEATCSASPTRADCEELKDLYSGAGGLIEILSNRGLTDYSTAHSLARAIGDDGLIEHGSRATVASVRFYGSEQSAEAVSAADYYLTQLSLLISLIGAYQTAPATAISAANLETDLEGITEVTRPLPGLVPRLLPATNLLDTGTGLIWQTQIAANTVLKGTAAPFLPPYYLAGLHSVHGASAWEMASAGGFRYDDGWIASDGSLKAPRTLGEGAPGKLGGGDWKPAPENALNGLLAAETNYEDLVKAGFAPQLFTPVQARVFGGLVYDAQFVATLPGDGAVSDFDSKEAALYGGVFNFKDSKPKPGLGMVSTSLDDSSLNFLMHRAPTASECWYYAQAGKPASC